VYPMFSFPNIVFKHPVALIYYDGLGNTSDMNVATQRSGTDLASPTTRLFRINGARER
jgi:hypothetical protein